MLDFFRFPKAETHSELAKVIWLVRLRWAAIFLFFCLAGPGLIFQVLNRSTMPVYIGMIAGLLVFNLLTQFIVIDKRKSVGPLFICFQLTFDLVILSALLSTSGGFTNPFVALYLLNAALGGVLIRGKYAWPFVILCHTFLAILQIIFVRDFYNYPEIFFWSFVFSSHVLVFSVWLVMRSLGSYLENQFRDETKARVQVEKQDRLRAIGALAAGFSHEFASPLNAAKLRLDRLARNLEKQRWLNSDIKENLSEAKLSIENCEAVIHSMNSSQLDAREHRFKHIPISEFVSDVTSSWLEEHPDAKLQTDITIQDKLWLSPINLAQVMLNLLDNAFEAKPEGLIHLTVSKNQNNWLEFTVEDHGPGFSQQVLSKQGEPFVTTKPQGTGLGLYVSEIFVQSLSGKLILANNNHGTKVQGAKVTLTWPVVSP